MKQTQYFRTWLLSVLSLLFIITQIGCNEPEPGKTSVSSEKSGSGKEDEIKRGAYLVTVGSCSDCHSPKNFTSMGPVIDSTRYLSGHPADSKLPDIDLNALKPGGWGLMASDATAFVGPWGISFTANLTPDSATGIGAWGEEVFKQTLKTGKHLGHPDGRNILPPMPWYFIKHMTDEDFKSMYTYLLSIPAVSNRVPAPVPPTEVQKMASK